MPLRTNRASEKEVKKGGSQFFHMMAAWKSEHPDRKVRLGLSGNKKALASLKSEPGNTVWLLINIPVPSPSLHICITVLTSPELASQIYLFTRREIENLSVIYLCGGHPVGDMIDLPYHPSLQKHPRAKTRPRAWQMSWHTAGGFIRGLNLQGGLQEQRHICYWKYDKLSHSTSWHWEL